jgi:hypothetical protein
MADSISRSLAHGRGLITIISLVVAAKYGVDLSEGDIKSIEDILMMASSIITGVVAFVSKIREKVGN